jgi:hypothetical protein
VETRVRPVDGTPHRGANACGKQTDNCRYLGRLPLLTWIVPVHRLWTKFISALPVGQPGSHHVALHSNYSRQ